jgi:hypothetical protein
MSGLFKRAVGLGAHQRGRAAEGRTHSKTLRARGAAALRASVLDCAQPSGAFPRRNDLRPTVQSIAMCLSAY